ncbi:response regulator transcription factor [Salicibibacter cibarius]|uniref:Response regulator transcription factor n=1 Tax=Salicibibacter cibarius TaxID=2743000 RepID=A0A7T6Z6X3_9BACI|nr:LuxR C-terminal-related transcriptional regulator [Salicibibacter cibarius]QQK77947.1 response regulator transcription factor [Salicibibacter cibarius]
MIVCLTFYEETEAQQRLTELYKFHKDMYFDPDRKRIILERDQIHVVNGKKASLEQLRERPLHKYVALINPGDRQSFEKVLNAGVSHVIAGSHSIPTLAYQIKNRTSGLSYIDPVLNIDFLKVFDKATTRETGLQRHFQLDFERASSKLSFAECRILQGILEGKSNLKIAESAYLAKSTVNNHVSQIIRKINAKDRTHAIKRAIELDWITGALHDRSSDRAAHKA